MSRYAKTESGVQWLEKHTGLKFKWIGKCGQAGRYESLVTHKFRKLYKSVGNDPQGRRLSGKERLRNIGIYLYKQTENEGSPYYDQWVVGCILDRTDFVPDKLLAKNKKKEVPPCTHDGMDEIVAEAQTWMTDRVPRTCLLYTSPSPRDRQKSRMPSSA